MGVYAVRDFVRRVSVKYNGGLRTYLVLIKDQLVVEVELERIGESRLLMRERKKVKKRRKLLMNELQVW